MGKAGTTKQRKSLAGFKATQEEKDLIKDIADEHSMTLSEYMRYKIFKSETQTSSVSELQEILSDLQEMFKLYNNSGSMCWQLSRSKVFPPEAIECHLETKFLFEETLYILREKLGR